MASPKITTLFLDIGGVLLSDGWGKEQRLNAIKAFELDEKETEDRNALVWDTYEAGKLTLDDYLDFVIFQVKRPYSKEEFKKFMMEQSKPLEGALAYFKELKKERGYKIVALSNEARELNEYRIKQFELGQLFDFFISSCYVGLRKPDPAIYKLARDTTQTLPNQAVYIDDRLTYIQIALKLGVQSLHYTGLESAAKYFNSL